MCEPPWTAESRRGSVDEPERAGPADRLRAAVDPELLVDAFARCFAADREILSVSAMTANVDFVGK
jgi:hypothetical protein